MMLFAQDSLSFITSPADIDSLFYWFEADMGVTDSLGGAIANNEGVGAWADLSGNGYDVTQTTDGARPVYKATGGPGSKPAIQFDGSNDFLASAAHWWGSDDLTAFVVMKFGNAMRNANEAIISKNYATGNKRQWQVRAGDATTSYVHTFFAFKDGMATNYIQYYSNEAKGTSFKTLAWGSNGSGTVSHYDDGNSNTLTSTVFGTGDGSIFNDATALLGIGINRAGDTPNYFLQGSISAIIVYTRALTTAERTAIENYLNKKYDLY